MNLFAKRLIQSLIVFAGLYLASIVVFFHVKPKLIGLNVKPAVPGRLSLRIEDLQTCTDLDILIIGSSHAFMGFATSEFHKNGKKAFVLASVAQTPSVARYLIERFVEGGITPKVMLYEVYPEMFMQNRNESLVDLINSVDVDLDLLSLAVRSYSPTVINALAQNVFKQKNSLAQRDKSYVDGGGDIIVNGLISDRDTAVAFIDAFEFDQNEVNDFRSLTDKLRSISGQFILFRFPMLQCHVKEVESDFTNIIEGMQYLDYSKENNIDSYSYYNDPAHLNRDGAIRLHSLFFPYLDSIISNE